jgi:5'(3')-deoxyribonucleotidase
MTPMHFYNIYNIMSLNKWFIEVKQKYKEILEHIRREYKTASVGNIMLDLDETIVYKTTNPIPGSIEFVKSLAGHFNIYIVTGRIDKGDRRRDTLIDLQPYIYHHLIMRPDGINHRDFKKNIKHEINAIFSIGDQINDFPDFLIPNPFYYINDAGDEIYLK